MYKVTGSSAVKSSLKSIVGLLMVLVIFTLLSNCDISESDSSSQKDSSPQIAVDENTCEASDVETLQQCVKELVAGEKIKLYISSMIECADNSCSIKLEQLSGIIIFGSSSTKTGIRRNGGYDSASTLSLKSCSDVLVQDLYFDDMKGERYIKDYPSTVWVDKSSDVTFHRVTVMGGKGVMSVGVSKTENFSLTVSTIEDCGAFGLWVKEASGLLVKGCTFKDNRSNAVLIDTVSGETWGDNLIADSDFEHNHCDAVFNVCDGPCPGGQIDVLDASYLTIRNNTIHDGFIDTFPEGGAAGIELNDGDHIMIEYNTFWNNTGTDLYQNSGNILVEVYAENNSFDDSLGVCTRNMEQVHLKDNTCD